MYILLPILPRFPNLKTVVPAYQRTRFRACLVAHMFLLLSFPRTVSFLWFTRTACACLVLSCRILRSYRRWSAITFFIKCPLGDMIIFLGVDRLTELEICRTAGQLETDLILTGNLRLGWTEVNSPESDLIVPFGKALALCCACKYFQMSAACRK
ncbi:hypothetical protein F4604DRAFT_1728263 [Suillus subluteus]|nr:hypothetical protein F4604DRAFT_1728263 [Suillus subluteus]